VVIDRVLAHDCKGDLILAYHNFAVAKIAERAFWLQSLLSQTPSHVSPNDIARVLDGAQGGIRTRRALDYFLECHTGDSRAYSRSAPAGRGPGYTTSTHPYLDRARARHSGPGQRATAKEAKIKLS